MPADGQLEHDAIVAHGADLFGGRVFDGGVPDGESPARPYLVIATSPPIAKTKDRGIGVTEAGQPHVLPVIFEVSADHAGTAIRALGQVFSHYVGWRPDPTDSGEMRSYGSSGFPIFDSRSKPSRWVALGRMAVDINYAV